MDNSEDIMNKKIAVITGISGQNAKTLTHILLEKGNYHVIGTFRRNTQLNLNDITNLFTEELSKNPNSSLSYEICDITDKGSVEECLRAILIEYGKIDELYLFASQSHAGQSFKQKEYSIISGGQSVYYFLESVKNLTPKTKTFVSLTSELFAGHSNNSLVDEHTEFKPLNPYAFGKNLAANWTKFYRNEGLFVVGGILFNHSGIYRSKEFFTRKITSAAAEITKGTRKSLDLGYIDFQKDESLADFVCEVIWKSLQLENSKDYVIGRGINNSGVEFLEHAFRFFNLKWQDYVNINKTLFRPVESSIVICNPTTARKELGWNPNRISLKDHIHLMCKHDWNLVNGINAARENPFLLYPAENS